MKKVLERSAAWAMDAAMCGMMNAVQWRRRSDSSTRAHLDDYITKHSPMTREEYFRMPPATGPKFSSHRIEWESPLDSGHSENDRVRVDFFPAARKDAPVVFLLHALMSASDTGYRRAAEWFNRRGWHAAFPHLPYHYSRRPRRTLNGELAITSDLVRNAQGLRQGVVELRQLMALLRTRGTREFGLVGTSYGGWTGALLSFVESDFRFVALVQPIVNVEKAIWDNPGARTMRASLRALGHLPGATDRNAHLISPLDGVPLTDRIVVTGGLYDKVSPISDLELLVSRWRGAELIKVRQGHFGYLALRATLDHIAPMVGPTIAPARSATKKRDKAKPTAPRSGARP